MPKLKHTLATAPFLNCDYTYEFNSFRILRDVDDTDYPWRVDGVRIEGGVVVGYTESVHNFATWEDAMRLGPERVCADGECWIGGASKPVTSSPAVSVGGAGA